MSYPSTQVRVLALAPGSGPGQQQMLTQVAGFLSPTWETRVEFLAPGLPGSGLQHDGFHIPCRQPIAVDQLIS